MSGRPSQLMLIALGLAACAGPERLAPSNRPLFSRATASPYRIERLGNLTQDGGGVAYGINDNGTIVGASGPKAFRWTQSTGMVAMQSLTRGGGSVATAVNSRGLMVGYSDGRAPSLTSTRWGLDGHISDITPAARNFFEQDFAVSVNDRDVAAGYGVQFDGEITPYVWSERLGGMRLVPRVPGSLGTAFTDINNRSVVVGQWIDNLGSSSGVLWSEKGGYTQLGLNQIPQAINDAGEVAGLDAGPDEAQAWRWNPAGGFTSMGPGFPLAINNAGVVAGITLTGFVLHATVWLPDGTIYLLQELPGGESEAFELDSCGRVVGWSKDAAGFRQAVRWTTPACP